jgi:hypothetical protein
VFKQLPVEMFQQCLSGSSCMPMYNVIEKHYILCQHTTPFVLNGPTQFFSVLRYKTWLSSQATDFDAGIQKLIFPDMTSASILVVTMLKSNLIKR